MIKIGSSYSYIHNDESKIGVINQINDNIVSLDNGDNISLESFSQLATPIDMNDFYSDDNPDVIQNGGEQNHYNHPDIIQNGGEQNYYNHPDIIQNGGEQNHSIPIRLDSNGMPVLDTNTKTNVTPTTFISKNDTQKHPIIELLNKANLVKKQVNVSIDIDTIDEDLYDILTKNFQKSDEVIIKYLIDKIDVDEIKKILASNIQDMYKKD